MCGIVGFLGLQPSETAETVAATLGRMAAAIAYRGPDDSGSWQDLNAGIALGHRRLSILDLSPAGHQPMRSPSERYGIVFNGEIYNHLQLREELRQSGHEPRWRGHSDTETLLAGFEAWGIPETIRRSVGMFAMAVWDAQTRVLSLVRDRVGEKPLYYGWQGNVFLVGSELKALRVHPAFGGKIDRRALTLLLRHNYIPAPYSIYEGVSKLQAGAILTVSLETRTPKIEPYWSGAAVAQAGNSNPFTGSPDEAIDQLETLLKTAVQQQMVADVPLGAFLSGGIDSSTVVALMQASSSRPVKSFSIGFGEAGYDEAPYAKAVARHLGTDHTELYVTPAEALRLVPRIASIHDEPFSDSSQIPTYLVSQLARKHVTVSLSGDAGDELFCGYNRYQLAHRLWGRLSSIPMPLRRAAARCFEGVTPAGWDRVARGLDRLLPRRAAQSQLGTKLQKGVAVLASPSPNDLYLNLVSHWLAPASVVVGGLEPDTLLRTEGARLDGLDRVSRMMALDLLTYLPDDILVKVDRAAMSHSLETRVPFLDHRVVEFAWRLPQSLKLRDGDTKWVLRQVLYRHVPRELVERPKMGFGVPLESWLRGPLKDWAEALLSPSRLKQEGYFEAAPIREKWDEHQSGRRNWHYHLWDVLMFQSWLEQQSKSP